MSKSPASAHRVPPYKRPIIVVGFLIVLITVVTVTILICMNLSTKNGSMHTAPDSNSNQSTDQTPDQDSSEVPPDEPEDKAPQYEGENPNLSNELTGRINYNDLDPETQVIHAMVTIDQFLQNDGQCIYNLKRDDAIIRTASAVAQPDIETSVCGPFNLSASGLSGVYQVEIVLTGDNKRGVITSEIQL